jgi:hypothetical protein
MPLTIVSSIVQERDVELPGPFEMAIYSRYNTAYLEEEVIIPVRDDERAGGE